MEKETTSENELFIESIAVLKKKREHLQSRLNNMRFTWWGWLICSLIGGGFLFSIFSMTSLHNYNSEVYLSRLFPRIILGSTAGAFMYGYIVFLFRTSLSGQLRRIEYQLVQVGSEELQETIEENFFTKLVKINFKYLDQYYLQTQEQADKSFRLASFAAISGLLIIVVGILMMLFNKTEPAYVTTGAGILSEFIAAVFFYLYNRTILKMSQYHQKLVITQNISLALKITDDMDKEQKIKSLEMLVDRLTSDVNKYLTEPKE